MSDKFQPGDRVFAKIKGWPPWPAKVLSRAEGKTESYLIQFYGTYDTSTVKPDGMFVYNDANKAKYGKPKNSNRWKEAMEEIANNTPIGDSGPLNEEGEEIPADDGAATQAMEVDHDTDGEGELMIDEGPPTLTKEVTKAPQGNQNGNGKAEQPKGRRGSKASLSKRDSISSTTSESAAPTTPAAAAGAGAPGGEMVSRSGRKIKPKRFADDEIPSPVTAIGKAAAALSASQEDEGPPPSKRAKRAPKTPPASSGGPSKATPTLEGKDTPPQRPRMVIGKGKGAPPPAASRPSAGRISPDISSPLPPKAPSLKPGGIKKMEPSPAGAAPIKKQLPALIPAQSSTSGGGSVGQPPRRAPSLRQQQLQQAPKQAHEDPEPEEDSSELPAGADDGGELEDKENVKDGTGSNVDESEEGGQESGSEDTEKGSELDDTSSRYSEIIGEETRFPFADKDGQPFEIRLESKQEFETDEERAEYENNLGLIAKVKEDLEQGEMDTHETLQEVMEVMKDEFEPEEAYQRERRANQIRTLRMEGEVIEIIGEIVSCLSEKQADCYRAIELLERLGSHELTALVLKKHPEVVRTIGKLRNYIGNVEKWEMNDNQIAEFRESATAIRIKAADIYGGFYALFIPPEERDATVSFEDIFKEEMKVFREMTQDLSFDELLGLTAETEGGFEMFEAEAEA